MAQTDITRQAIWEDTAPTIMARVQGSTGGNIQQADVSSMLYDVWDLDGETPTVALTTGLTLASTSCVFDTLQTDSRWSADTTGYNFRATLPSSHFATGDHRYRVEVWITPASTAFSAYPLPYELHAQKVYRT